MYPGKYKWVLSFEKHKLNYFMKNQMKRQPRKPKGAAQRKPPSGKARTLARRSRQKAPLAPPKPPRQNQTREITDFPLGTNQRNGFNRNSASKIVTKDEYIGEVAGTVAFTTTQYAVNPGQASTFPWLSKEALQWEKYEFLELEFYLKPEVTQYTTNANSGKVILSFDSDASDAAPLNKQEAEDVMPMADGMSYQTINLNIPKFILASHVDSFYVRPGNLPGSADIKTYDLGNLFVSTLGQGGAVSNMMELRVRYKCQLMIPILENTAAAPQNYSVTALYDTTTFSNGVSTQCTFAQTASSTQIVTNGLNAVNTAGSIVLPPGNYIVAVSCTVTNGSGDLDLLQLFIQKNANTLNHGVATNYAGGSSDLTASQTIFYSSNGTDALTVIVVANSSGGTNPGYTTLTIFSM
jgi:hypothetical protein